MQGLHARPILALSCLLAMILITGCQQDKPVSSVATHTPTPPASAPLISAPAMPTGTPAATPTISTSTTPTTPTVSPSPIPTATPAPTVSPIGTSNLGIQLGIPDQLDLRSFDGPVVSQFGGTCTAFGTAAAMDNVLHQKGIHQLVSERHLWDTYQVYDIDSAIQAAIDHFITEEQYWPIGNTHPAVSNYMDHATHKITSDKEFEYDWKSAVQAMGRDHRPLVMAIQVPQDLDNCVPDINANSAYTTGQHVIEAVGYKLDNSIAGGGYFIIKNSWGPDCGDHGYHYYPFQICNRSDMYCYFTEIKDVE